MVFVFLICPQNTLLVAFIEKNTRKYDHRLKELPNSLHMPNIGNSCLLNYPVLVNLELPAYLLFPQGKTINGYGFALLLRRHYHYRVQTSRHKIRA